MHGFCTDFARFQNVQRVLFAAKSDKGCRNCWAKNHVALFKNNDESKLPQIETNRRLALLISGSWVRVPDGAPQNTSHEAAGYFLLLVFEGTAVCAPLGTRMACCGGDRRLRRKQRARAGAAVAEDKPHPRGAGRCGNRKS